VADTASQGEAKSDVVNHPMESLTETKSTIKKDKKCVPTIISLARETITLTIRTALDSVAEEVAETTPVDAAIKAVAIKEVEERTVADTVIKAVVLVGMVETNPITTMEIGTTTIRTICIITMVMAMAMATRAMATMETMAIGTTMPKQPHTVL